jgi:type IV pilus assembly protein PilM
MEALGTRTRDVAMALPAASVITKKIMLPGDATEAEIDTQITRRGQSGRFFSA